MERIDGLASDDTRLEEQDVVAGDRHVSQLAPLQVDPCQFAGTDKIMPVLQAQLTKVFPMKEGSVTLTEPRLRSVICAPLKVVVNTRVAYKPSALLPTLKGTLTLESPVVANVVLGSGGQSVESAKACMTGAKVTKVDMKYVPSIVDRAIRYLVNRKVPNEVCGDVTALAASFTSTGRRLTPIGATAPAPVAVAPPAVTPGPDQPAGGAVADRPKGGVQVGPAGF